MSKYTTGQFAKMANVTERTVRYYDKIGLLKPSSVMENGYRKFSDKDFLKLQKILSLKQFGFTIEEIFPLVMNDDEHNMKNSFEMQMDMISKRIAHLQYLKEALKTASIAIEEENFDWSEMIELVRLTNMENEIVEQYKNSSNLNIRIALHERYSTNEKGWFSWLQEQIDFTGAYRLLEIGCGNGALWFNNRANLRNREIFLSDISEGMIRDVRNKLGKDFNCIVVDCEQIPFKNAYFDILIANHVLFYLKNKEKGVKEIQRVLRPGGYFYCTTYGKDHMKEITEMVTAFDSRIVLSEVQLYDNFGLDNGECFLKQFFKEVKRVDYSDRLIISEAQPLIDYILSCHGNQNEIIGKRINEFKQFVSNFINNNKSFKITKNAGLFICKK